MVPKTLRPASLQINLVTRCLFEQIARSFGMPVGFGTWTHSSCLVAGTLSQAPRVQTHARCEVPFPFRRGSDLHRDFQIPFRRGSDLQSLFRFLSAGVPVGFVLSPRLPAQVAPGNKIPGGIPQGLRSANGVPAATLHFSISRIYCSV